MSRNQYRHWQVFPNKFTAIALPEWKNFEVNLKFIKVPDRESYQNRLQQTLDWLEQFRWMNADRLCEFVRLANVLRKKYFGEER